MPLASFVALIFFSTPSFIPTTYTSLTSVAPKPNVNLFELPGVKLSFEPVSLIAIILYDVELYNKLNCATVEEIGLYITCFSAVLISLSVPVYNEAYIL